jgi:carbon-monoxide dehydrogenase large subunit
VIGEPLRRLEDPRLITGRGRYVDDLQYEGTMHAAFVRSIEAHARVAEISFEPSEGMRAVLLTAEDLDLLEPMAVQNPSPAISQPLTQPPLAGDEVCYAGQPIAVVVAPTVAEAMDAVDLVLVEYQTLPASVDHRTTLEPDAPPVHQGGASNRAATLRAGYGDAEAAFARAEHSLALQLDQHRGAVASLEGRAVLARWDDADERLTVWTSSQSPHAVKKAVAEYLALSADEVRVTCPDVGGGFGPKAVVYPEEIVVAALARHLHAPVKWIEMRREHFTSTAQQRGQSGTVEVAYQGDGSIIALRARLVHDLGAYVPYGVIVAVTTMRLMSGPYTIANLDVEIDCVFTNATPTGAIRGAGRPNAVFALERVMDAIARDLSLERAEVRRRNFVPTAAFPYQLDIPGSDGKPLTYDGGDYVAALEAAVATADLDGFEARRSESALEGRLRGYGIASYVEDTGTGPYDGARVEVLPSGEVVCETGASSQGQGHATVFAQICASHLGVDPSRVRVRSGDTDRYGQGVPTVASRTGQTAAAAVHVASAQLAETIKRLAAARMEAAVEDIVLIDDVAMVVGQPGTGVPLSELSASTQAGLGGTVPEGQDVPGLSAERVAPFGGSAFTYGTHVAEVEIDSETGHVAVLHYVVVHDCGTVLNPMIVAGQIDGGVAHGLGNALFERVMHDELGQPLTASFMGYKLVTAIEMPALTKVHMETPSPTNALGAKGAGEGGTIPAAAAVVSAIEHAIGAPGPPITHYPVSTEWILEAIQRNHARAS